MVLYLIEVRGFKLMKQLKELWIYGQKALDWKITKLNGNYEMEFKTWIDEIRWNAALYTVSRNRDKDRDDAKDIQLGGDNDNDRQFDEEELVNLAFVETEEDWNAVLGNISNDNKVIMGNIEQFMAESGDGDIDQVALYKICFNGKFNEIDIKNNMDENKYIINGRKVQMGQKELKVPLNN
eukprot:126640_1